MKVILSAHARQDLFDIGDFIATDHQARARSFVAELGKACLSPPRLLSGSRNSAALRRKAIAAVSTAIT